MYKDIILFSAFLFCIYVYKQTMDPALTIRKILWKGKTYILKKI